jgi:hypothetical protein
MAEPVEVPIMGPFWPGVGHPAKFWAEAAEKLNLPFLVYGKSLESIFSGNSISSKYCL